MSRKRPGLGKGLDALIPQGIETPSEPDNMGWIEVELDRIHPNPRQPRSRFDPKAITELAESITEHGVIQPLILSYTEKTNEYTLIAGERRLIAAKEAGLKKVPAIIREVSDQDLVEIALIENIQRADLGPLEKAEAFRQLTDDFGLSHETVAKRVGKSRVTITNTLRLLNLPLSVKDAISSGTIREGHARALLGLPTTHSQSAALQTIIKKQLSVRQTEALVRRLSGEHSSPIPKPGISPQMKEIEAQLQSRLGTKVTVKPGKVGGNITIRYYSDEELSALMDIILE